MKKKFSRIAGAALGLTLLFSTNAFAEWKQDDVGWWYENTDGTYAKDGWNWIDEKCYYFTPEGYCLINTTTPDGYQVDGSGAWIIDEADESEIDESADAYEIFELVNKERINNGESELEWNDDLAACAQQRANEIAELQEHIRPDGSSWTSIFDEGGISYIHAGENIASGQKTPERVMTAWMESPSHKRNILSSKFGQIGVGCAYINGRYHWVQFFID